MLVVAVMEMAVMAMVMVMTAIKMAAAIETATTIKMAVTMVIKTVVAVIEGSGDEVGKESQNKYGTSNQVMMVATTVMVARSTATMVEAGAGGDIVWHVCMAHPCPARTHRVLRLRARAAY